MKKIKELIEKFNNYCNNNQKVILTWFAIGMAVGILITKI